MGPLVKRAMNSLNSSMLQSATPQAPRLDQALAKDRQLWQKEHFESPRTSSTASLSATSRGTTSSTESRRTSGVIASKKEMADILQASQQDLSCTVPDFGEKSPSGRRPREITRVNLSSSVSGRDKISEEDNSFSFDEEGDWWSGDNGQPGLAPQQRARVREKIATKSSTSTSSGQKESKEAKKTVKRIKVRARDLGLTADGGDGEIDHEKLEKAVKQWASELRKKGETDPNLEDKVRAALLKQAKAVNSKAPKDGADGEDRAKRDPSRGRARDSRSQSRSKSRSRVREQPTTRRPSARSVSRGRQRPRDEGEGARRSQTENDPNRNATPARRRDASRSKSRCREPSRGRMRRDSDPDALKDSDHSLNSPPTTPRSSRGDSWSPSKRRSPTNNGKEKEDSVTLSPLSRALKRVFSPILNRQNDDDGATTASELPRRQSHSRSPTRNPRRVPRRRTMEMGDRPKISRSVSHDRWDEGRKVTRVSSSGADGVHRKLREAGITPEQYEKLMASGLIITEK